MKAQRLLQIILISAFVSGVCADASAQENATEKKPPIVDGSAVMTDGEIRKIDRDNRKVTIRHAEIKHLDMPGMTMIFQVNDPALLDRIKTGDKVKFRAEKTGGLFFATEIKSAK